MLKTSLHKGIRLSLIILTLFATSATNAKADVQPTPPIFGDITIGPKFSPDPYTVRGMSGGSVPGKQVAGRTETTTGPCTGFVDQTPDHTLQLTSKFDYLKLVVDSPEDTTLIIIGPGGTWCNDDFDGKNAGMVGEWLPGTYQIWVGSYKQDQYYPYSIKITQVK